jgi:site-specific DNA-methyltransferase (adenine-specific)
MTETPARRIERLSDGVTLYLGDCREILPELPPCAAVISDPPYGINFAHSGGGKGIAGGKYRTAFGGEHIVGDDEPFDPRPFLDLAPRLILWGGNHFANRLPASPAWFVWDKRVKSEHSNSFADCEIAWTNLGTAARMFRHHWDGMMRDSEKGIARDHPTQKPIALMRWCIEKAGIEIGRTILDPFMGSGTTGVAAVSLGRKFIGVEIEEKYFDIARRRIADELARPRLDFEAPAKPAEQIALL